MSKTKTYQSIYCNRSIILVVEGDNKRISFTGSTNNSRGIYTTSSTQEQEAIEARKDFGEGNEIYLFRDYGEAPEEVKQKTAAAPKPEKVEVTTQPTPNEDGSPLLYPGITTVQKAGKVLRDEFKVTSEAVSNREKVLAKAIELNVSFPDLP